MLTALGVLGAWIALQWWVLPRLGVPNPRGARACGSERETDHTPE
jgi:hypothetical protein